MHDTGAPRLERGPVDGRRSPRVRGGGARAPDRRAPRAGGARGRAHGGEGPRGRRARAGGARRGPRRDGARPGCARRRGTEHAPLLPLADLPRLQGAPPGAAPGRAPRERLARDRACQRRRAGRARGVRARRAPRGVPVRALAGARHHLPGGEAALRGAARRVGCRARARAREHARAPREPVRGQGARRGVDPGFPPRRGGTRRSGATMTDERRWLDRLCEGATRALARRTSRRSFLTRLGTALAGTAALPLLPVARADEHPAVPDDAALHGEVGDPKSCNYWRHCAIDGFLCACCGGSQNTCPPGTERALAGSVGRFLRVPGGREFLVRVPGVAQAPLDDAALAAVLNWMLERFGRDDVPKGVVPYAAAEVGRLRRRPLTDVEGARRQLLEAIERAKEAAAPER